MLGLETWQHQEDLVCVVAQGKQTHGVWRGRVREAVSTKRWERPFPGPFPREVPEGRGFKGGAQSPPWLLAGCSRHQATLLQPTSRGKKRGAHTHAGLQSTQICSHKSQMGPAPGLGVGCRLWLAAERVSFLLGFP